MVERDWRGQRGRTRSIVVVLASFLASLLLRLDFGGQCRSDFGTGANFLRIDRESHRNGSIVTAERTGSPAIIVITFVTVVDQETDHYEGSARSHVVEGGDEGNATDQVRALPQERQLGRDLESAGGGEDRLGGSDGGAEGGQR